MTSTRFVSAGFGVVMAAAAAVDAHGPALIAAAAAGVAVLAGLYVRAAATAAVLAVVCAIALSEPQPMLAALAGLSAAAYLVLRHATLTRPTVIGLVGFTALGMVATTAGTAGRRMVKVVPTPGRERTLMAPPWFLTMECTTARPRPLPVALVVK